MSKGGRPGAVQESDREALGKRHAGLGHDEMNDRNEWMTERVMAKANLFKFMQEVRDETQKVTWPSRRETAITTLMVFVMVFAAAVFFFVSDQFLRLIVTWVLGIGG